MSELNGACLLGKVAGTYCIRMTYRLWSHLALNQKNLFKLEPNSKCNEYSFKVCNTSNYDTFKAIKNAFKLQ